MLEDGGGLEVVPVGLDGEGGMRVEEEEGASMPRLSSSARSSSSRFLLVDIEAERSAGNEVWLGGMSTRGTRWALDWG